jgi:hypothetical protein
MAEIKNYTVAFRDRAVVKCCGADNLEKVLALRARPSNTSEKLIDSGRWRHCCRILEVLLSD